MSAISSIQWTDRTWNPVRGCSVISPGCHNCYAMKQAHRFSGPGKPYAGLTKQTKAGPQWTGDVATIESSLREPLSWRKPCRVFVNSMSDLFHENVPDWFIDEVFATMALSPRHTFQILTKRAKRMRDYMQHGRQAMVAVAVFKRFTTMRASDVNSRRVVCPWPLPNVWLGVSVEDQPHYYKRIGHLLRTPAAIRFLSYEPALGPLDLRLGGMSLPDYSSHDPLPNPDWLIVGGESGPGARPFDLAWARSIVYQCKAAGIACFVKQLGANAVASGIGESAPIGGWSDRKGGDPSEWPEDLRIREFPEVPR
jgi:protein gp37